MSLINHFQAMCVLRWECLTYVVEGGDFTSTIRTVDAEDVDGRRRDTKIFSSDDGARTCGIDI